MVERYIRVGEMELKAGFYVVEGMRVRTVPKL